MRGWTDAKNYENPEGALISDMINIEYRFPVWNNIGGDIFIDLGRLYNEISNISTTKISWDYGFGVIYNTTLGPIRIDIGFPYGDLSSPNPHASLLYMF